MPTLISRNDKPFAIDLRIFHPCARKDRHDNDVSDIMFPDFTYNMVHHPTNTHVRESGNIYRGRDQFVRYSAFRPDNDNAATTATIFTNIGEFHTSWGDGDNLGFEYPEVIKAYKGLVEECNYASQVLGKTYEEEEAAFVLLTMGILHCLSGYPDTLSDFWLNKDKWEVIKARLTKERNERRLGTRV